MKTKITTLFLLSLFIGASITGFTQPCNTGGPTSTLDSNVELVELTGDATTAINHAGCPGVLGVEDLTVQSVDLTAGGNYTLNVTFGTCGGNYDGAGEVWIDWNQNMTFEPSEIIGQSAGTPGTAPWDVAVAFNFTVPLTAGNGATYMRVMQEEGGTNPLDPCGSYNWGSVMDFLVNVSGGVNLCMQSTNLNASNITQNSADLSWTAGGASNWNLEWGPIGFTPGTGTLEIDVISPFNVTGLSPSSSYSFYIQDSCGVGDVSGWSGPFSFSTTCGIITSYPYTETFDAGVISQCWTNDVGDDFDWEINTGATVSGGTGPSADHTTGTGYYLFTEASTPNYPTMQADLLTPSFDITSLTAPTLNFWYHMYGTGMGDFHVDVFDGSVWNNDVFTVSGDLGDVWNDAWVDLSAFTGTIQIRFRAITGTDFTSDFAIDDFSILEGPTCWDPTNLNATNIDGSSADLSWTTGGASNWVIEWGPSGFTPGTGTQVPTSQNPHNLTGLAPTTNYDFYVQDSCGIGDVGNWVGPFPFTTTVSCPEPSALNITYLTDISADLGWTTGGASNWNIEWGPTGFALGTGTMVIDATNPYSLASLTPLTTYDFWVQDSCGVGDASVWVGPFQFTTTASCPDPANLNASSIADVSAILSWDGFAASMWSIQYGAPGFPVGTGTDIPDVTNNPYTLTGLTGTTMYDFYVLADCGADSSSWVGPFTFETTMTPLTNPSSCQLGYAINDNESIPYPINVTGAPGTQMGTDLRLTDVNFIAVHTWDGDLDILLESPTGITIDLTSDNGGSSANYGVNDGLCTTYTNFNMNGADGPVTAGAAPFIGSFIPEGDFASFNDGSDPNGIWTIHIGDDATGDQGTFEYIELIFTPYSSEKEILTYSFPEETGPAVIDNINFTVDIEVDYGTNLTGLIADFTVSDFATAEIAGVPQITGVTANDFTNPVTYTVIAENGTTQDWIVTVSVRPPYTGTDILTYSFPEETGPATIDDVAHTVDIEVGFGTSLLALVADFTLSMNATTEIAATPQVTGVTANDFTSPVTYMVIAEDGITTQEWTVTVTVSATQNNETEILAYSFPEQTGPAIIDNINFTVDIEIDWQSAPTALVADFTLSYGASAAITATPQVSGLTANDFTNPVTYTVTAEDGATTQDWVVTVTIEPVPQGTDCSDPIIVGALPYSETGMNTANFANIYSASPCDPAYISGDEVIYSFTPASDIVVDITVFNISDINASVHVLDSCPDIATTCFEFASNLATTDDLLISQMPLTGGVTYVIVVSTSTPPQSTQYDLLIEEVSCADPINLGATSITDSSADLLWTEVGSSTTWSIEYGAAGFALGTGTNLPGVVNNPYTLSGLTESTNYSYYVMADCGADSSAWVGPFAFTTTMAPITNPSACGLVLPIAIITPVEYPVNVTGAPGTQMGLDIKLTDVNFIVEHPYDADVELSLISPNGVEVALSIGNGGAGADFGVIDGSCTQFTNLNMFGVDGDIGLGTAPFIGSYIPDGDFNNFNDGSDPNGYWRVKTFDNYPSLDDGTLEYIELIFGTTSAEKEILTYSFPEETGPATIDNINFTVDIEVDYGTDVTVLIADFTLSNYATAEIAGVPQTTIVTANDFTTPVTYTVIAENGSTQDWIVTVTIRPPYTDTDILTYSFPEETGPATIDDVAHTVDIEVGFGTSLLALVADFTLSMSATANIAAVPQVTGVTANDFTNPVLYTVIAEDGTTTQDWTITVTVAASLNTETEILTYSFPEETGPAIIDNINFTVDVEVDWQTVPTALVADFTLSYGATTAITATPQVTGLTANDFTNPVTYTVTAEDGLATQDWIVTVTVALPPPGVNCTNPIVVGPLPYLETGMNTLDYGDVYSTSVCNDNYISGDEVIYTYTPATNTAVNISVFNITDTYAGIHVLDDCPDVATTCYTFENAGATTNDILITELPLTGGVTYYIVISTWTAPQSTGYDLLIEEITCPDPSLLEATNITDVSASLGWTETGSATEWIIEWGTIGFTPGTGNLVEGITTNPYDLTGLTAETTYDFYVRSFCSVGDSSGWSGPFVFSTTASCPDPDNLDAINITSDGAELSWNGYFATTWSIEYGTTGFAQGTGTDLPGIVNNPYTLSGLTDNTAYDFYVMADCGADSSNWVGPFSFTTLLAPLTNPTACGLALPVQVVTPAEYLVNVTGVAGSSLGTDVFLSDVNFIVQHPYDADVELSLISPNGVEVALTIGNGGSGADFGVTDGTCTQFTNLNMTGADGDISTGTAPFIGSFIPDGDFAAFDDGSDPNGMWRIKAFDNYQSLDDGTLEYFEIVFQSLGSIDLAVVYPEPGTIETCDLTATDTVTIAIQNSGDITIPAGDSIQVVYQINGGTPVYDTIVLAFDLLSGDTLWFDFAQTYDFSATGTYDVFIALSYNGDAVSTNNLSQSTIDHLVYAVDIIGGDTVAIYSYELPFNLTTIDNHQYYYWENFDGSANGTLSDFDATDFGWYYVSAWDDLGCYGVDSIFIEEIPASAVDLAVLSPSDAVSYEFCDMTDMETVTLEIVNSGANPIPDGDSIFVGYNVDATGWVSEWVFINGDLNPGEIITVDFTQTYDFSSVGTYQLEIGFQYTADMVPANNSVIAQIEHVEYILDLDVINGATNDTLEVGSYPTTISGGTFAEYLWHTSETTPTISVNADGWVLVEVFNSTNCYDIDSMYVILGTNNTDLGSNDYGVYIYPNPAKDIVNIIVSGSIDAVKVDILSIHGQLLQTEEYKAYDTFNEQIDISDYAKGIYYLRLTSGRNVNIEKIVVQ